MRRLPQLLVITFIESLATTLIERAVYFFSQDRLGFTNAENLWLALGFGATYVVGALASHRVAQRVAEKHILIVSLVGQFLAYAALCILPGSHALIVANAVLGGLNGLKWPIVESYVSAGQTPSATVRTVGRFNLAWVSAIPVALGLAGPLIAWEPRTMFALAAAINVASLVLVRPLERRPVHLAADHPERPTPAQLARYGSLLASARWSMLSSYALMWILAALLPHVFAGLNLAVSGATALAGLLDVARGAAFLALQIYTGWHNRRGPLVWVIVGLPAAFFLTLFGGNLAAVLVGEILFGATAGLTYYAALYYAMVVKNASVEAGGAHEGLIGTGFVLGPAAGLLGGAIAPALGGQTAGMLVGIGPLVLVCGFGALRSLLRCRARGAV